MDYFFFHAKLQAFLVPLCRGPASFHSDLSCNFLGFEQQGHDTMTIEIHQPELEDLIEQHMTTAPSAMSRRR